MGNFVLEVKVITAADAGMKYQCTTCVQRGVGMSDLYAWPEFIDAMGMGGAGTAISPYTIHNVYDLQAILFDRNAHYKLSADIDGEER